MISWSASRLFVVFYLSIFLSISVMTAATCDCGDGTGRAVIYPDGILIFDEEDGLTENEESVLRSQMPMNEVQRAPAPDNMTDVLEVIVTRVDGFADRDGLWNNSDPYLSIWYAGPDNVWSHSGTSPIVEGCDGAVCDAVFDYTVRIPVARWGDYHTSIEVYDDDPGGTPELLGKKGFRRIPSAGLPGEWRLLDDNINWNCWVNCALQYEDNGIDDPEWISQPPPGQTSEVFLRWTAPLDRSGLFKTEVCISSDTVFGNSDDLVQTVYGQTDQVVLGATSMIPDGEYHLAIRCIDNNGWASHYIPSERMLRWLEPTPVPPTLTPTSTPNPSTPTPMPGSFTVGDVRVYADLYEELQPGVLRATGNLQINDYVSIEGSSAYMILHTEGTPWIEGQGLVKLKQQNLPVFIGDFEFEPVEGNPDYGILIPGDFLSQIIEIAGYFLSESPLALTVNVVEGWVYIETLVEIAVDAIGLHLARVDCVIDWNGYVTGNVHGFSFTLAGVIITFDHGQFNNTGIHIDHFNITLPENMGGGYADAWGLHITTSDVYLDAAHIVLPVIRLEGGFEITGFDPNTGPEAWIERLLPPDSGYKWCVDGRMRIPNLGEASGALGIETTFSIYGDRLQQACILFEAGNGLQIPIGSTGLFLYKLGGCVTFNNLPYPDTFNQCATGTIYDCNAEAFTCCHFDYPDSIKVKLIAGLQGGPDILGMKCVHADPLWLDIDTGWGVGGGGTLRVIENFEVGAGRVCVAPHGTRVDGWISVAIVQGSLYLLVTPDHAEGCIEGSVTIPPGDYWLFDLDEPINLGQFMLMLGYYNVPQSDFWGSGIWSSCNSSHCEGLKYGVRYSHDIFGQLLCVAVDQNRNVYAWIDLDLWGSAKFSGKQEIMEASQDVIDIENCRFVNNQAEIPIVVPSGLERSLFSLGFDGPGQPILRLKSPDGEIIDPLSADDKTVFYNQRDGAVFYSIRYPEEGTWIFLVENTENLGQWEVQLLQGNRPPEVSIESVLVTEQKARIQWAGDDKEGTAKVALYYDTDNQHGDGIPIATSLSSGKGDQLTNWDISGITTGSYYLYAKIDDGHNPPVINYFSEPVEIEDSVAPQAPGNLSGSAGAGAVHLWWNASESKDVLAYEVRYAELTTVEHSRLTVVENEITIGNLANDTPYRFIVVAKDLSGNWSQQSNELILRPDGSGDLQSPDPVTDLTAANNDSKSISVFWEASIAADTDYYLVYYGTVAGKLNGTEADQGRSPVRIENGVTQMEFTGLHKGSRYFFSVQSVDTSKNRSPMSTETTAALISDADIDVDQLPDDWEACYWGSLENTGQDDYDEDGLTNIQEYLLMTNPGRKDSDFDRIPDSDDMDPIRSIDMDVDGIADDWEYYFGIEDATADPDNDQLSNLQEYRFGTYPAQADTDADGIPDGEEAANGFDPTNPDDPHPRCQSVGVRLKMPSQDYRPGDVCFLTAEICNSFHIPIPEARFFTLLTVAGETFYAPGWTCELDYWSFGIQPGPYEVVVIKPFVWPEGAGNGSGVTFIGAVTDSEITEIIGEYSVLDISWQE